MTNPTSNYGFVLPTSTDLVTDLPADFEVALQGVDTRLKALQPGTTLGDIAYSSATANTNTRLPIGSNGQVLAVSAGVPAWTTTADVTPLTTKGDLFTFTTADARLGVGTDGQTLVADSSTATGLKWATPSAGGATFYGCQLYKSVSQSTSNNAYTALTFENEYVDVGGYHSGTSSKIIIPAGKAGTYLFTGQVSYATAASGLRFCAFYKNNSLVATGNSAFGSTTWDTTTGTLIMTLAVADEIELVARQNSGGSLNVVGEDSDNFITRFGCVYLGA